MFDAITAVFARDRFAEQFAGPVHRAAVHGLRTVADRLEPASRRVQTGVPAATPCRDR
jgi:hypothetical protein